MTRAALSRVDFIAEKAQFRASNALQKVDRP
jgi:hypothetical protein